MADNSDEAFAATCRRLKIELPHAIGWNAEPDAAEMDALHRAMFDGLQVARLVAEAAAGSKIADAQLRAVAIMCIKHGQPLPDSLGAFVARVLRDGIPNRRGDLAARDFCIVRAVRCLETDFGIAPTRNHARKPGAADSGCAIVAKALAQSGIHMSEAAVAKIWQRMRYLGS